MIDRETAIAAARAVADWPKVQAVSFDGAWFVREGQPDRTPRFGETIVVVLEDGFASAQSSSFPPPTQLAQARAARDAI